MPRSLLGKAKDAAVAKAVLLLVRPKVERYGEILKFELDSKAKVMNGEIRLRGEDACLVVSEAKYRLEQRGEETVLIVHSIKVSKEWVQHVLEDFLPEIRLKIPQMVSRLID
jgi:hypothetical protein